MATEKESKLHNQLPVFKSSGKGLTNDLANVEKQMAMTLGWWKGQFRQRLEDVSTIKMIDGILCYSTPINIGRNAKTEKISEFLKIIGFDDDTIQELYDGSRQKGIRDIQLKWKRKYEFEKEDFEDIYDELRDRIPVFDRLELVNTILHHKKGTTVTNLPVFQVYDTNHLLNAFSIPEKPRYSGEAPNTKGFLTPRGGVNYEYSNSTALDIINTRITIYDSAEVEIPLDEDVGILMKVLLYLHGTDFLEYDRIEVVSLLEYEKGIDNGFGSAETWVEVTAVEHYSNVFDSNFSDLYPLYKQPEKDSYSYEDYNIFMTQDTGAQDQYKNYFWMFRTSIDTYEKGELTPGLFYRRQGSLIASEIYMTVEGLDAISPLDLQKALSRHLDIFVIKKHCHGFFSCLWSGIKKMTGMILTIIAKIFWFSPLLRFNIQVIIYIFTKGNVWANKKKEFEQYASIVIMTIIAITISILSAGTLTHPMMLFLSAMTAYSLYGMYNNLKELKSSIEYNKEMQKLSKAEQKLIEEALDETEAIELANRGEVDTEMFMPLDRDMKHFEKDLFGRESMFNIDYTKGMPYG